jgi:hypothetical protein
MNHNLQQILFKPLWIIFIAIACAAILAIVPRPAYAHHGGDAVVVASVELLDGLSQNDEECGPGEYLIEGTELCSHGADTPPTDEELEQAQLALETVSLPTTTVCIGDGTSGKRVQVMYVRPTDKPNRYANMLPMIRKIAINVGLLYDASAAITGGNRLIYYVTTPACAIDVLYVEVPPEADDTLTATVRALSEMGYNSPDRKYLIFMDSSVYCGIATVVNDRQSGPENKSNHRPGYARIDNGCWNEVSAAHELTHTLGGIQHSAPHSTGGWHCTDEYDVMCYSDAPYYPAVTVECSTPSYGSLLDCHNDDYFSTNPAPGSYLATNWNVANSMFLIHFDHLAPNADATLTITSTNDLDYLIHLDIIGGAVVTALFERVEFYVEDQLLDTVTSPEFEATWQPAPGEYTLRAHMYLTGNTRVFQEMRVKIPEPPAPTVQTNDLFLPLIRIK